ncbi:MAG: hypothetical protein NDI81_09805 [Desulfobacula sp.]|nr:hypothetical protein [Desulfobacula sp.]
MNCDQFQNWLLTRDVFVENEPSEVRSHLSTCAACKRIYMMDTGLEKDILTGFLCEEIPKGLMDRIDTAIDGARTSLRLDRPVIATLTAGIILAAVFFFMTPNRPFHFPDLYRLGENAVLTHLRGNTAMSFTPDNLDEALAKMRKELEFDVTLPDLSEKGYTLLGGRLCFVGDCRTAYLFYRKNGQIVSLFILSHDHLGFEMAEGTENHFEIKDCRADIWKENGQIYALVSSS